MNRIAIVLIAAAIIITGCSRPKIKGDGVFKTEDRAISDYCKIVVTGEYLIKWSSGKPALHISTEQNLLPLIKTVISGDTMQIDSEEELVPTKEITIVLSSTSLVDVRLNGDNSFKASQISSPDLKLESTGKSKISVGGSVATLEANLRGASKLDAKSLRAQTARLSLTGASYADVTVTDTLIVSVTGAGFLTYSGNPTSVEKNITGVGSIVRRP